MVCMPTAPYTSSRLQEILDHTRAEVGLRRSQADLNVMERQASEHTPRGFLRALREKSASGVAIIAELKKASPSKGMIRPELDAAMLAGELAAAGAAALSVLTEEKWFLGSLANLRAASERTTSTGTPCLRKDFMLDDFQILEARANRADAVLLIAAALDDAALQHLADAAYARELDVLCEVHTEDELDRVLALRLDPDRTAIGVNSRNLHTFDVSLESTLALADRLYADRPFADRPSAEGFLLVAESGIANPEDIGTLRKFGFGAFLIGESLMRASNPAYYLSQLLQLAG
jgi:indole-3-glycerol phosphate synthase